ncbi:arylsulfatase : Uncultured bacterium genome assembly Metasoil_fosmids_resub OS=uncultured bacterium PE=4 SV=1: Sulfatase [Gemmata massiliana]|uniref:Sulfatase N-terminal domain-containing protein n=1 Tax=Gemmata massiliana TaxID=1210884 RepID=A0A6P2CRN5_9BACT|nr:arylsulfatase [Gemmata massiliana]VTR91247.1 arylsulfatase : Uncultured bacterium genome assembly Metasoil_fosmids_resub OS=uncultured bacterium PE=4 SV=1: Sulfatase [Gemmata massiliana]
MRARLILPALALIGAGALLGWATASGRLNSVVAREEKAEPVSTSGTPEVLPRPDFHFKGSVGRTYLDSDKAQFPQPVQAPKGAPNIVLILLDDAGYGQFSTFGGGIPSPTMDKLAAEGLRYNRFHTTALCSPTRAALITGRNHHSAAFAGITELATGYDGYSCILPKSCGTVGEVLRQNGYNTAWVGKNHNTPPWDTSDAGPFDRWANGLGFDYFYGFNAGDMNHWNPVLYENRNLVPASPDPNYHLTEDLADKSIAWARKMKSIAPDKPFFLYVAPGATHAPHHAPKEWIEKFKGKFDGGWDKYREETLARQKKLGVVPESTKLTERSHGLPAWDSLNADQKKLYARMMEVFCGYGAHVDHHMGRVIDAVKQLPGADNTLFVYIAGDNGSSAEGGIEGSLCENMFFNGFPEKWQDNIKAIDELGGPKHFNHFPSAWAHAMNTPFQWTKQIASHFGGTRNPMIVSWPAKIKDGGGLRSQFTHTIDLVPTLYDVCGITAPTVLNGVEQKPIEGTSFAATFTDAKAPEFRKTQYFEMCVNRGIYHDGWFAGGMSFEPWNPNRDKFDPDKQKWELYNINEDFSQATDLAAKHPEKLRQLQDLWWVEASKYNVLPLDWRGTIRMNAEAMGRPSLIRGRKSMTYYPGTIGLPDAASPPMTNKSWTITAEIEATDDKTNGMIVTHGGLEGGYGLYLRDGVPTFVYNFLGTERKTFAAKDALPKGKTKLVVDFKYDGGGMGKGGAITVTANGKAIAEGRLEKTIPIQMSLGEGLDIGMDVGSPVDFTYKLPFKFTGTIEKVTVDLK